MNPTYQILLGDCMDSMKILADKSVNCVVTSPPYFGLRDYGHPDQIGLEKTPDLFVAKMVEVFREVRRVLRDDGTVWLNLGDSYAGSGPSGASYQSKTTVARESKKTDGAFRISKTLGQRGLTYADKKPIPPPGLKPKDLIGIPWRVAFALQADGWYLRQDIIWAKPNPMPESVTDRCTKSHEYIFMLTKSAKYWYDHIAIKEPSTTPLKSPDASDSAISGGAHGRHVLDEAIPVKERRSDKQRGHGRKHAGFNDRWDTMTKEEQGAMGRNKRSVWTVAPRAYKGAHFATYPPALIEPCILAGCPIGGTVLDPFGGSGTTAQVALKHGRNAILCELNPDYRHLMVERIGCEPT